MPNGRSGCHGRSITAPHSQRGVVLLIALIMLVAMTLAGIGMMRSVDTGNVISGNLAFQQATVHASDAGTSTGFNALAAVANSANATFDKAILSFNSGQPCPAGATAAGCPGGVNISFPGYASTPIFPCEVDRTCATASNYTWYTNAANWAGAPTIIVREPNNPAGCNINTNCNTIATVNYLIHRMCNVPNLAPSLPTPAPAPNLCQTITETATGCSHGGVPLPCFNNLVVYRITSRSMGTRNTVTYGQTLSLIPFS